MTDIKMPLGTVTVQPLSVQVAVTQVATSSSGAAVSSDGRRGGFVGGDADVRGGDDASVGGVQPAADALVVDESW